MAFDFTSKVLTKYEADASDHIAELKKLKDKIAEAQKAELDAHEKRQSTYDNWLGGITAVNQGLEIASKALKFGMDAWKAYSDDMRMAAAAGAADIGKLRDAAMGLRTESQLMEFAAKAQHGVIKANQSQMETAQRAMVALTRAGFDQEEVTHKVTEAMVSLKVNGLDSLGVAVKKGSTDAETYGNLMAALGRKAAGVEDGTEAAGEGVAKLGVTMQDSMGKMKAAIGQLVQSLAPLLTGLAKAVALIADLAQGHAEVSQAGGTAAYIMQKQGFVVDPDTGQYVEADTVRAKLAIRGFMKQGDVGAERYRQTVSSFAAQGDTNNIKTGLGSFADAISRISVDAWGADAALAQVNAFFKKAKDDYEAKKKDGKLSDRELYDIAVQQAREALFPYRAAAEARAEAERMRASVAASGYGDFRAGGSGAIRADAQAQYQNFDFEGALKTAQAGEEEFNTRESRYQKFSAGRSESKLAEMFGPIEDFNVYAAAFTTLGGAVTSAMDAWISGSMSAGQAIKKFIAEALKGLASQMAIEALKHGAYALGSLAFYNYDGAAKHGAAAAAFGGAAVAAATAAKALGGSGGASGPGAATGAGGGSTGASGGTIGQPGASGAQSGQPIIFVLGDHFGAMDVRQRQLEAEKNAKRAFGRAGYEDA